MDFSEGKDNLEDYQKHQIQGIPLYISKKAKLDGEKIIIDVAKLWKWKKLIVEGLKAV